MQKLFDSELKVMELIWANEPISAKEVSILADKEFGWNKNTTYTVIKRLGERGVLKNEDGKIRALVSKEDAQAREISVLVEEKFQGSLPAFVAAFAKRQDISNKELDEVQRMIDRIRKGG